jgi:hypothetical protein
MFMRVRRNRTAIHLHPFRGLCQPDFFGFHRFFMVFSGFCGSTGEKWPIFGKTLQNSAAKRAAYVASSQRAARSTERPEAPKFRSV